jgi:hypothetical protein
MTLVDSSVTLTDTPGTIFCCGNGGESGLRRRRECRGKKQKQTDGVVTNGPEER